MQKYLFICFLLFFSLLLSIEKIDLNTASLEDMKRLPITEEQAEDIYDFREYISFFKSIYQLREIDSIDQETLNAIKPHVIVSHYEDEDEYAVRRQQTYYLIQRLGSNEGFQEGISDTWEDYLITPQNINKMTFSDVLNMPNTSPLDAAAVLRRITMKDTISSYRDLRQSYGISYYGASNLRHYVYYKEKNNSVSNNLLASDSGQKLFVDYQFKYNDAQYKEDIEEMYKDGMLTLYPAGDTDEQSEGPRQKDQSYWGYFNMEESSPEIQNKLRIRYGNLIKAGLLLHSRQGELSSINSDSDDALMKDAKYYLSYQNEMMGNNKLNVVVGNYRATFGEGLVMENTDFYSARKTGYGFSKRITGVIGDLSRTQEYSLKGFAVEWKNNKYNATIFYSNDKKDAVVYDSNGNGEIDSDDNILGYITMSRRFDNDDLEDAENFFEDYTQEDYINIYDVSIAPRTDVLEEKIIGVHFDYTPIVGTHLGFTAYEAVYDREFVVPEADSLKYLLFKEEEAAEEKFKLIDSEISSLYSTKNSEYNRNFRRVLGFDWRTVLSNTSIQGEYAELTVDGEEYKIGDDPKALLISTYSQFENLYLITLYRDYDLDFDNPYSRGFSEHQRFDDTSLDKYSYSYNNTLLKDMYNNSAQAQAERGFYVETRYRISTQLTLNRAYVDMWERKADGRKSIRFQGELMYSPIFNLRFYVKHKYLINRYDDDADRGVSESDETTGRIVANLSNYDRISLEYRYSRTWFPPYTYLTNDPDPDGEDNLATANSLLHGDYICVDYTHNFNENLKVRGAFMFWDGHGASHWDWEDMEIDFMGEKGNKFWFSINDRISNNLYITLKYKVKHYRTREYEWRAWWNEPVDSDEVGYLQRVERTDHAIRLQIDYKF